MAVLLELLYDDSKYTSSGELIVFIPYADQTETENKEICVIYTRGRGVRIGIGIDTETRAWLGLLAAFPTEVQEATVYKYETEPPAAPLLLLVA